MLTASESANVTNRRVAILLVAVGVLLAVDSFLKISLAEKLWPLLITITGGGMVGMYRKSGRRDVIFLAVGVYLIAFSAMALYLNFTDWGRIAALWPMFVAFLGLVFVATHFFHRRRRTVLRIGLLLLSVALGFSVSLQWGMQYGWTVLILVGLSLLVSERTS
jgi:uncharacterized membrane protein